MSGFFSLSFRAFFTATEQQIRLQLGRSGVRDPTHWIMTTLRFPLISSRSIDDLLFQFAAES